jgi:hypothetical protein
MSFRKVFIASLNNIIEKMLRIQTFQKGMRAQSAMEYLMTYGWAILIIAIVLVALFSLGIFNSANFAPKAQPGSCEVLRNSAQTSLAGQCNNMLPAYVAQFNTTALSNITTSNVPALAPNSGDKYTVTFWIKPLLPTAYGWNGVAIAPLSVPFQIGWWTDYSPNGVDWIVGNPPTQQDTWAFIVVNGTVGGTGWMSINGGGFTTNSAIVVSPVGSTKYTFGSIYYCCHITAMMSNIQLYNTPLSANEIQVLYKEGIGGVPVNVNNLVGWWTLNGNANDYSGYGNDGTATNVVYTSAWTSGYSAP